MVVSVGGYARPAVASVTQPHPLAGWDMIQVEGEVISGVESRST